MFVLAVLLPLPAPTQVAVTVPSLIAAVAAFVLLLLTLNVPFVFVAALNVPVVLDPAYVNVPLVPVNVPFVKLTVHDALATLNVNVDVEDLYVLVAGHVTVITDVPCFAGVNVIVPLLIVALATAGVPLDTVGVAPLEHVAVKLLLEPYVPFTVVDVEFTTVVDPSFTVVVLAAFAVVNAYVLLHSAY